LRRGRCIGHHARCLGIIQLNGRENILVAPRSQTTLGPLEQFVLRRQCDPASPAFELGFNIFACSSCFFDFFDSFLVALVGLPSAKEKDD